jgi:hypothetical protein
MSTVITDSTSDPIVRFISSRAGIPPAAAAEMLFMAHEMRLNKEPDLMSLFVKTYRIPNTHMQWPFYRAMMLHGTASIDATRDVAEVLFDKQPRYVHELVQLMQSRVTHNNVCQMARKYGFPFWLVSRDLCDLLAHTDSLADPNIDTEAKLPFRALHFSLPSGAVVLPDGDSVTLIGVADLTLRDVIGHGFDVPPGLDIDARRFYVAGHTASGCCFYSRLPVVDGVVADPSTQEFTLYDKEGRVSSDTEERDMGARCADIICGWALRFLIVMNAEPELIESEVVTGKRKAKRNRKPMDFLDPRWLGRRIIRVPVGSLPGGTHATPTTHWRKGHTARRRCGKGRVDTRVVWIKPVLVNGPKEMEVAV